ncbi:MAG: hypothetical protein JO353_08760, partial [Phycisphaerae bacterium]|nr:hypothetical protein [Phycisphaerae bacterium]
MSDTKIALGAGDLFGVTLTVGDATGSVVGRVVADASCAVSGFALEPIAGIIAGGLAGGRLAA